MRTLLNLMIVYLLVSISSYFSILWINRKIERDSNVEKLMNIKDVSTTVSLLPGVNVYFLLLSLYTIIGEWILRLVLFVLALQLKRKINKVARKQGYKNFKEWAEQIHNEEEKILQNKIE